MVSAVPAIRALICWAMPPAPDGMHLELDIRIVEWNDEYQVHAHAFPEGVYGEALKRRYRSAVVSGRISRRWQDSRFVDEVVSNLKLLHAMLFPRPLPVFRIATRGPKRLQANTRPPRG